MIDENTISKNGTKKCERNYYLVMFLGVPVSKNVKFSLERCVATETIPWSQCKCIIHENFINKLSDL